MTKLYDLAKVLRSKNSGPFEITLDCIFDNEDTYYKIKKSNIINSELISKLYHIPIEKIVCIVFFDQALGFKVTLSREVSSGTFLDTDVYGAQYHAPLMELLVDI